MNIDSPRWTDDTIAAIATPVAARSRAAIGIVRLSGPKALDIARELFSSSRDGFQGFKPYRLHHGRLTDPQGRLLDEALAAWFPGPGSYTGEDLVEFSCHGGAALLQAVLNALLDLGARQAEPGEFTRRAFLNGKMDLTQAEAVAEAIAAPAETGLVMAQHKLAGALSRRVGRLRQSLERLRVELTVAIDFPEDEVECLAPDDLIRTAREARDDIRELLENAERSRLFRDGALAVLAGPVNAGKSSLFNALLGRRRAIVADLPGTTRDFLEETLLLDGLPLRLADTAGLRLTDESVELQGLALTRQLLDEAQLVLLTVDALAPPPEDVLELARELGPERVLCLANKCDLFPEPARAIESLRPLTELGLEALPVSAREGLGLEVLARRLRERLLGGRDELPADLVAPNLRQARCLRAADTDLAALLADLDQSLPYDLLLTRLEGACAQLAELTGEITPQAVLDAIFSSFCIGK